MVVKTPSKSSMKSPKVSKTPVAKTPKTTTENTPVAKTPVAKTPVPKKAKTPVSQTPVSKTPKTDKLVKSAKKNTPVPEKVIKKPVMPSKTTPKKPVEAESPSSGKKRKSKDGSSLENKSKKARSEYIAFVGRLQPSTSKEKLIEALSQFGKVLDIDMGSRGGARFAFVSFADQESLDKAVKMNNKFKVGKRKLIIAYKKKAQQEEEKHSVRVTQYKNDTRKKLLNAHFSQFGKVHSVRFFKFGCVVRFVSKEGKEKALAQDSHKIGGQEVKVEEDKYEPNEPVPEWQNKNLEERKKKLEEEKKKQAEDSDDEDMEDEDLDNEEMEDEDLDNEEMEDDEAEGEDSDDDEEEEEDDDDEEDDE